MNRVPGILLLLLIATSFSGCMSMSGKPKVVIMQHPETMEFYNCEVAKPMIDKNYLANELCVEEYKKKGYIVWGTW